MKDSYYFSHDSNAHADPRIVDMLMDLKAEGYGVYWVILEMMRNEEKYQLCINDYNAIAYQSHSTPEVVESVVTNYGLFKISDDGFFWSESLKKRMEHLNAKRLVLSTNAKKRWENAKAEQEDMPSECSKVKKSKVKEIKDISLQTSFQPPSVKEVEDYCRSVAINVDPQNFVDFYESKGWKVGKEKMKDWKAAARRAKNWETNNKKTRAEQIPDL